MIAETTVEMLIFYFRLAAIAFAMQVDLETELYSLIRLLVYNRKAKIVDVVRLVNVYSLPPVLPRP